MDVIISLLISYGYWGMLVTAFIAGSFFPFSSEAVMMGLLAAGLDPWGLIIYGTIGNVAGGMFNYTVGHMGKLEWIEKYLHVSKEKLDQATRFIKFGNKPEDFEQITNMIDAKLYGLFPEDGK